MDDVLLSTNRFLRSDRVAALAAVSYERRKELLERFGIFGLRLAMMYVRQGRDSSPALAAELVRASGLHELQDVLAVQFAQRRDLLKARSGLLALERVLAGPAAAADPAEVSSWRRRWNASGRARTSSWSCACCRRCAAARSSLPEEEAETAERLLGGQGVAAGATAGPAPDGSDGEVRAAALHELDRWRRRAEDPFAGPPRGADLPRGRPDL